jgi:hypothetical protein
VTPQTSIVVPAKAGTHNHRQELLRELPVTSFFASTPACGYGSRIGARLSRRVAPLNLAWPGRHPLLLHGFRSWIDHA